MEWYVALRGTSMKLGGFGSVPTSYGVTVHADDRKSAIQAARAVAREKMPEYADGRVQSIGVVRSFAVTVRGRKDKRKRETFVGRGRDEQEALTHLRFNSSMVGFAGTIYKPTDERVIRIKEVTPA